MQALERAVIDLVRMGLHGDTESVRQYARRLLRRAPGGEGPEGDYREALGELLLDADVSGPALRRGSTPRPLDGASTVPSSMDHVRRSGTRSAPSPAAGARHLDRAGGGAGPPPLPPTDAIAALQFARVEAAPTAPAPALDSAVEAAVRSLLDERHHADALSALGVTPSRTVLLTGAPGVGKTMTARHLAAALALPLVSVDLAAVMSSFLGRTGQNLRQVLDYARSHPCVLLLDEFDALAKRRDDESDIGELKRIVNVLLLELESWPTAGLLVAATNHPELLDRAIWRRFDLVIALGNPSLGTRRRIIADILAQRPAANNPTDVASAGTGPVGRGGRARTGRGQTDLAGGDVPAIVLDLCALVTDGASGSDVAHFVRGALRTAALEAQSVEAALTAAARRRLAGHGGSHDVRDARAHIGRILVREFGMKHRAAGELLGVSHVTIGNWLKTKGEAEPYAGDISPAAIRSQAPRRIPQAAR